MDKDRIWAERHQVIYKAELSALYHQKRERFFDVCDKLSKAASLVAGSGALWKLSSPGFVAVMALIVTTASAFSLVLSFSERSRRHAEFARRFRLLLAEIHGTGSEGFYDEQRIRQWKEAALRIEAEEPPALGTLVVICQNEIAIAENQRDHIVKLPRYKRWLANFFDFNIA